MKRHMLATLFAMASLFASAAATVINGPANGSLELTSGNNEENTIIVAAGGSTITFANGSGNKTFYPHLVVSGGVVRVSSSGFSRYRFVSGVRAVDGGSLEIDGVSTISIDRKTIPSSTDIMPVTGPLCDFDNVSFTSGSGKLAFNYNATVRRLPNCKIVVEPGDSAVSTTVALACADATAASALLDDGSLCLTNFNAIALTANALPDGCHVRVSPGRSFSFKPAALAADGLSYTPQTAPTGRFNIELLGRGATVCFANDSGKNIRCESNINGVGEILFKPSSETAITRFRGMTYRASSSSSLSIPVDSANEPAPTESWKAKVAHWFDASDADTIVPFTFDPNTAFGWSGAENKYNGNQIVIGIKDKVEGSTISLYNARIWSSGNTAKKTDYQLQVMPYLVKGGLNGKDYLCCGQYGVEGTPNTKYDENGNLAAAKENRRLPVWNGTEITGLEKPTGTAGNFPASYCIMVFGSQQGGGLATLGTVSGYGTLARSGSAASSPWMKYDGFTMHVDGLTEGKPKENTPNGGWQVVSIDMTGTNTLISGIGQHQNSNYGGQNYAEVIFFSEKPTTVERAACERYLAEKWGLESSYAQWDVPYAQLSGSSGTVTLYDDARTTYDSVEEIAAEGSFSGTVIIPSGKTLVIEKPLPPTEADVPETNRVGWYDPDFSGAVVYDATALGHDDLLYVLYGRTLVDLCTDDNDIWFTSGWRGDSGAVNNFAPSVSRSARGALTTGPKRNWLNFKESYGDSLGNMIRSRKVSSGVNGSMYPMEVRQGFFVVDTSSGGGDIFNTDAAFSNGKIKPRTDGSDSSKPIWRDGTVAMSGTWLDTDEINGAERGYNGRAEVLSFATESETLNVGYVANYSGSHAEIVGEFILYSEPLEDAARTKVQEYLMYKWFGDLNGKYADYSGATVTGAGTVKSPTLRNLPKFGDNFTGELVGGSRLEFSLGETGVVNPIAIGRALSLEDGATVTVNVTGKKTASGNYTLLTAESITGTATLDVNGLPASRRAKLHVDTREIWMEVSGLGMMIILR